MPQFGGPLDLQGDVAAAVFHIQRTRPDADGRVRPVDCRARPQRQQVGVHAHRACARRRQHQAVGGLQGQRRQVEHGLGLALRCRDGDLGADDPQAVHAAARRRAADQMVDAGQGEAVGVADAQAGVDQHRHRLTSEVQRAGTGRGAALQRRTVAEGDLRRTVDDQPPAIHQHHAALEEHRAAGVDDQVAIDIDLVAEGHVHRVPHVQAFQRSQFVHAQREALRRGAGAAQVGPCRTEQIASAVATTQRLQRHRTHPAATDHQHGGHARPAATRQGHIRVRAVGVSLAARGQGEAAHAVADGALQRHRAAVRGQVEHIAAPHPAIDAAGDGEVAVAVLRRVASHQADAAGKAQRIVDQQIATHRDGGAIGQAGRLARANDRQRLAGESAADRDLATLARRVDHQRHGQRHAVLAAADRDRVGPTTGPQHQRRDGRVRIRQPIGIQHHTAGATAQGDGRRRIGGHHLQALAGAIRLGQVGQLGRAGAERHRAQHHGCSGIQAAFFGGGELAAQRDCVAHIQLDAACRQIGGDHQLVGLDRQAGVAQVDHTAGFHRLQLDPVADEVQRAQRLVPEDLLNPADRLARAQPDHVVGQALADRRQRQRQRVVGQFPRAAAGARARVGRRCQQRNLGQVHEALAVVGDALDLVDAQRVVLVGLGVVERDRAHRAAAVRQVGVAVGHHLPVRVGPRLRIVRSVQGVDLRVPLPIVVIGARGQAHLGDHLRRGQRHDHAAAGAVEVQVLGAGVVVERARCLLVGRAIVGRRLLSDHVHHPLRLDRGEQRHLGNLRKALTVAVALDRIEAQGVVLVRGGVVEGDRAHRTAAVRKLGVAMGHHRPVRVSPGLGIIRSIQGEDRRIPLPDVVVGARGQLELGHRLRLIQRHDQAAAGAVEVEVLGSGVVVKRCRRLLVCRAVVGRRLRGHHVHPRQDTRPGVPANARNLEQFPIADLRAIGHELATGLCRQIRAMRRLERVIATTLVFQCETFPRARFGAVGDNASIGLRRQQLAPCALEHHGVAADGGLPLLPIANGAAVGGHRGLITQCRDELARAALQADGLGAALRLALRLAGGCLRRHHAGLLQIQRARGRAAGIAQVQDHLVGPLRAEHGHGRIAQLEHSELVGEFAHADLVDRGAVQAHAVAGGREHLEVAGVVGRLHREGFLLQDRDRLLGAVHAIVDHDREAAVGALGSGHELHGASLGQQAGNVLRAAAERQHARTGGEQGHVGNVHEGVGAALRFIDLQRVVLVRGGVVETDRAHRTAGIPEVGIAVGHAHPICARPVQQFIGTVQGVDLGIPPPGVIVGARGELDLGHRLGLRQGHDHAAARAVEVQVLGGGGVVKGTGHLLIARTVARRWRRRHHRDPGHGVAHRHRTTGGVRQLQRTAGGRQRDGQAPGIGVRQAACGQDQVGRLAAGGQELLRQHQVRRRAGGCRRKGVDGAARGHRHHLPGGGVHAGHAPLQATGHGRAHLGPVGAAVDRGPHAAIAAVGRGRQRLAVVAHPDRGPVARQAGAPPAPAARLVGVGQVDLAAARGGHQQGAAGVHVHTHPVLVIGQAAAGQEEGRVAIAVGWGGHPDLAVFTPVRPDAAGHQQPRAVGIRGHRAPVGIWFVLDTDPALPAGVSHTHLAVEVVGAPAPVEDVVVVPAAFAVGAVTQHDAAIGQHQHVGVVVGRRVGDRPGRAAVIRQGQLVARGERRDVAAIGRDRDGLVVHALGRAGRLPGGPGVA